MKNNIGIENTTLFFMRSEEHTSELQSQSNLVCRLLLEKKKNARSPRSAKWIDYAKATRSLQQVFVKIVFKDRRGAGETREVATLAVVGLSVLDSVVGAG